MILQYQYDLSNLKNYINNLNNERETTENNKNDIKLENKNQQFKKKGNHIKINKLNLENDKKIKNNNKHIKKYLKTIDNNESLKSPL